MRSLRLREYERAGAVDLSLEERDLLQRLVPSLVIVPSQGRTDRYDLTPSSQVGAVDLGTIRIEIRPKIAVDRLFFLLSYALDPVRWPRYEFDYAADASLYEVVVPLFVAQVRRTLRRGLLQGYRTEEDASQTVRGRIRIDEQLRRRYGIPLPVEIRFDDFTVDIDENRLLRAALSRLARLHFRGEMSHRSLRSTEALFENVTLVEYNPRHLPAVSYTRLNEHYRPAVELARLIIRSTSFDFAAGAVRAGALVVDMNVVFEQFVVTALREALRLSPRTFRHGRAPLTLDEADRVPLRPDMSWWESGRCTFVGDVKYKATRLASAPNADLYQLLAYATATALPGGLLVYAAGEEEPQRHVVRQAGKELRVEALDLSARPEEILAQVLQTASRVRALRNTAVDFEATDRVAPA